MSKVTACGITQAGTARRVNEDSFQLHGRIYPDTLNAREYKLENSESYWQLYSLTDGMGGAGIGDISSRVAQSYLVDLGQGFDALDPYNFHFVRYIQAYLDEVDVALRERLDKHSSSPVGCSLALLMLAGDICYTMSIGSCRIYLYRDKKLYRMTEDHVLEDDAEARPLLFLGTHPGVYYLKAQNVTRMKIRADDLFFLCSDGITGSLTDEDIKWILDKPSPLPAQVESIFQNARRFDARDNQTILGLKVESLRAFSLPKSQLPQHSDTRPVSDVTRNRQDYAEEDDEYRLSQLAAAAVSSTRPINTLEISRIRSAGIKSEDELEGRTGIAEEDIDREEAENKALFSRIGDWLSRTVLFLRQNPALAVSVGLLFILLILVFIIF